MQASSETLIKIEQEVRFWMETSVDKTMAHHRGGKTMDHHYGTNPIWKDKYI